MNKLARRILLGGAGLVAVGAVVAAAVGFGGSAPPAESALDGMPPATAEVTETTLTQTQSVNGTLSYGPATVLTGKSSGTVTWMAAPGDVVTAGQALYKVDNEPVILLNGSVPPYRTMHEGLSGPDVAQLEANLAAFGYGDFTVDDYYGWGTTNAVYQWQADQGLPQTGTVSPDQIAVAGGEIRVAEQKAPAGADVGPGSPVLSYTGTTRLVQVALAIDKQQFVAEGNPATILLPDGTSVEGTVAAIGKVATTAADGTITIPVTVTVADQAALGTFEAAPVSLSLVTGDAPDVLTVPVTALVALSGGGFGVQVVSADEVTYVPVETGMFAGGMVEITGQGIQSGTVVGVAE